ncbi:MAG: outer membrane lipoprotein carrier protein LolA [Candidatus Auribacter fodinae]|jgi:outer membrane lipoprotein-sorting protein|uniref:Outer membrane lipoprotein carrier protein LolA n=1 Tax=Candidatus Auribacter fodinae TaxID=2093366 RepID=A0A3A4QPQ2_9BACT|nr:MAG: outer membrane lipoprotein carrier protein LolA [Candidatus Auribacter fodinae]
MKKLVYIFALSIMMSALSYCQTEQDVIVEEPAATAMADTEKDALLARLEETRQTVVSLEARFQQTKVVMPFSEKEYATGSFRYKAPDKSTWSFSGSEKTTVLIKGNRGFIINDTLAQVQIFEIDTNSRFDFIMAGLARPISAFFTDFDVVVFQDTDTAPYRFHLTPKNDDLKAIVSSFDIMFDPQSLLPQSFKLIEASGDITVMFFDEVRLNEPLDDAVFEYKVPPTYEVIDYR